MQRSLKRPKFPKPETQAETMCHWHTMCSNGFRNLATFPTSLRLRQNCAHTLEHIFLPETFSHLVRALLLVFRCFHWSSHTAYFRLYSLSLSRSYFWTPYERSNEAIVATQQLIRILNVTHRNYLNVIPSSSLHHPFLPVPSRSPTEQWLSNSSPQNCSERAKLKPYQIQIYHICEYMWKNG